MARDPRLLFHAKNLLIRAIHGNDAQSFAAAFTMSESFKGLADGLDLSRIYESAFLQLVANHVSSISEINPRRKMTSL